ELVELAAPRGPDQLPEGRRYGLSMAATDQPGAPDDGDRVSVGACSVEQPLVDRPRPQSSQDPIRGPRPSGRQHSDPAAVRTCRPPTRHTASLCPDVRLPIAMGPVEGLNQLTTGIGRRSSDLSSSAGLGSAKWKPCA